MVLLLHGQPGGGRDWERVGAAIGDRARTLAPDRPGWDGRSSAVDLAGNVQAAVGVLDRAGVERAAVAGHSFGGAVGALLAARHPERVRALLLAAPAANVSSLNRWDRWLAAPVGGPLLSAAALVGPGVVFGVGAARRALASGLRVEESYLDAAGQALRMPAAWRAFVAEQRVMVRELAGLETELERISAPTTIVIGSRDRIVPRASARRLATQIPGARLIVVEGAGHLLPLQRAGELAELIVGGG